MPVHVFDAVSRFSKKLKRFNGSPDSKIVKEPTEDSVLQETIREKSERLRRNVTATYKIYRSPFEILGADSNRAASIDADEQALFKAYNLYKSVMDLNLQNQDEIGATYIKDVEIFSPLAQKNVYISGGQFVYLRAWLCLEKNCAEYVPFFEEDNGKVRLRFERAENIKTDRHEQEILRIIKDEFYS